VLNIRQEENNLTKPRHTFIVAILKTIIMALDKQNKKPQSAKPTSAKSQDSKKASAATSKKK